MVTNRQGILEQLAKADRIHQQEAGGSFVLSGTKYICALALAAFATDAIFHLSSSWRLGLLLGIAGVFVGIVACGWYMAYIRRNRLEHIARLLETRHPALGSRLINLLQLQEQTRDETLPPLTRQLANQAIEGYAEQLRDAPLERLAWSGVLRQHLKRAGWVLIAFVVVLAAFYRVTLVELARFGDPFGDHPPFSFTHLQIVSPGPAGESVLYGKGFVVKAKATGHQPREVFLSSFSPARPEQVVTVPMFEKEGAGYDQLVDNIRTELVVFAHNKDKTSLSRQAHINIVLTPKLEKAFSQVVAPAYTGLKPEEKPYSFKNLQALAGSEVRFRIQSNRPLREGTIEINSGEEGAQRFPMHISADNEVTGSVVAKGSGRLRFSVVDASGLPSQDIWDGAITVTHDLPPDIRVTHPETDSLVAMDFAVPVQVQASDDYGLQSIRVHRGVNGAYSSPRVVPYQEVTRTAQETAEWNIASLGVAPGDVVSLFAEAVDTAPQPHVARSQVVRLKIISVEDYNNFLREQTDMADLEAKYDALIGDLQAVIEEQKKLGEEAKKLQEEAAAAGPQNEADLTKELQRLLAQQNEINQKLKEQAARMDNFVREKPLYDVEHELQEVLHEQAEHIRQSVAENDIVASGVAAQTSQTSGTRQLSAEMAGHLKQASDEQVARLGGVHEQTAQQVNETLQDMSLMHELMKDFNQFESLYKTQQEIAAQAQAYNRSEQLSREDLLALKELAGSEKQVADLLGELEQKLRDDAQAAEKLFPKAAKSGRDLAYKMSDLRLQALAVQATEQMLAGDGERSYNLAERLRSEMANLFTECQGGNCPSANEFDSFLALQRSINPGQNFAQMALSRKFGQVGNQGIGNGMGAVGTSGFAVPGSAQANVLGNEPAPGRGSASAQGKPRGQGAGANASKAVAGGPGKADVVKGIDPVNRESGAVASESVPEEYSDLVNNYFKAITTKKSQ